MIKISLYSLMIIFLTACGGGGSNSTETNNNILKVSPNILKIAYLSEADLNEGKVFSIDTTLTDGNVTLLDENTGRYSYFTTLNGQDHFDYNITSTNGVSKVTRIYIESEELPITLNTVFQDGFSSNLPIVIIDTGNKEIPDEPKIKGSMTIIEPNESNRSHLGLLPSYSDYMEIEIRGSSSQQFPKKQYAVDTETWDQKDDDVTLLGMPKEHKWILYAPYSDKSLMRNYLAYQKSREVDENKYYAVCSKFVELLTRWGDHYRYDGIYVFMEKIKRDKKRINIKKLKDEDVLDPEITGGYILKRDKYDSDEYVFTGINGTELTITYPKPDKINADQKSYIENHIQEFETALYKDDFNITASPNYYKNWIDEESFIVHFLSREFFRDADTWKFSEFFYKDREHRIAMGPVWDFNLGMGNCNYGYNGAVSGWMYETNKGDSVRAWMNRLMMDPVFHKEVENKWHILRSTIWSDANLTQFIDETEDLLSESAKRNFKKWQVLGNYVWPNRKACVENGLAIYCKTFDSAVNEHLKTWLLNRAHWLDTQF